MCIAIVKTAGAKITDEQLANCFDNNKDGAGLAYAKNGNVYVVKGIFNKKEFIAKVREKEKEAEGAMLIHCRIGTSGLMDSNNCHPHVVNDNCVLIHNGVLNITVPTKSKVSDTVIFVQKYLKGLDEDFMNNSSILGLIEKAIGANNKFCLLNNKGEYKSVNEKAGHWKDGIWFSNSSYSYSRASNNFTSYSKTKVKDGYTWQGWKMYDTPRGLPPSKWTTSCTTPTILNSDIDTEKVVAKIKALSNYEILQYGYYPVYDVIGERFVPESDTTMANAHRFRYLDDLDEASYEEYLYEIELRGLINELEDGDLDGTNDRSGSW